VWSSHIRQAGVGMAARRDPWAWWASIGSPRYVAAPMVEHSELAFRLLCREFGTHLTFTPMIPAQCVVMLA
jgi:tRNA-dihydrouridine synthase 4